MKANVPMQIVTGIVLFATLFILGRPDAYGIDTKFSSPDAPSITVDEISSGTKIVEDHPEIFEKLNIRLMAPGVDLSKNKGMSFQVQCFFFKTGGASTSPSVYDCVIFDVSDLGKFYPVEPENIALPKPPAKPKPAKKGSSKPAPTPNWALIPQFVGYCVNILSDGKLLSQSYSSTVVRQAVEANAGILDAKAGRKIHINPGEGF